MPPVRYLLTDPCATGFGDCTRSAGPSRWRMLLLPVIVVAAARVRRTLRGEGAERYQGLVRPFQRREKAYELRCGQLSARTIAAFAGRQ
jgi:hypothetical protein